MNEVYIAQIKNKIAQKLINSDFDPNAKNSVFIDQYKLLIDSAHKIEERRGGSNNIFLGINTLLASFLVRPAQLTSLHLKDLPLLILLVSIGIFISWEWLKVTASYKKLNFINYSLISSFEKFLPTYIFSLRGEIEAEQEEERKPTNKANIILIKENLLPKAFILLYFIYLLTILIHYFL